MDLGTNQYLQIGLVVDKGTPMTFDTRASEISRHPRTHWGVLIDTNLIQAGVEMTVTEKTKLILPNTRYQKFIIRFTSDGLLVDADGVLPLCGDVPFSLKLPIKMEICDKSNLRICHPNPKLGSKYFEDHPVSPEQYVCFKAVEWVLDPLKEALGSLFAGFPFVGHIGCPGDVECSVQPIALDNDGDFYATEIDTDNKFFIGGHSKKIDKATRATPPSLPSCDYCSP
jgi:hypothetical protein